MRLLSWLSAFAGAWCATLAGGLRVPLGPQIDRAALSRALDGARALDDGQVLMRPQFRARLACAPDATATVDALYDAMTGGRGPTLRTDRLSRWRSDEDAFIAAVAGARAYMLAIEVAFNVFQTMVYYVLFVASAAREWLGRELLVGRGTVDPLDAAAGITLAAAVAIATTRSLRSGD